MTDYADKIAQRTLAASYLGTMDHPEGILKMLAQAAREGYALGFGAHH